MLGNISNNRINNTEKDCLWSKNLETLNITLASFWKIEDVENSKTCNSVELNYCNEHFSKTHFRKTDGRYLVEMLFKPEVSKIMLGNSKEMASKWLDYL